MAQQNPIKGILRFFKRLFGPTHPESPNNRPAEDRDELPPIETAPGGSTGGVIRPRPQTPPADDGDTLPPITPRPSTSGPVIGSRPPRTEPAPTPTPQPGQRPPQVTPPLPPKDFTPVTSLLTEARQYLNTPYRYGGTDPATGFDCSGFLDYVFTRTGFDLPRTSRQQARAGREVARDEVRPGDLVYFSHDGETVHHIGLVTSEQGEPLRMIHASSSRGVIETNVEASSYWAERMEGIRRVIG